MSNRKKDRLLLLYYPIECKELCQRYKRKIKTFPLLETARKISEDPYDTASIFQQLVAKSGDVNLPADFWIEFHSNVGGTGDIYENHKLLEQITQFQHHAEHKRTSKYVQSYQAYNSLISSNLHEQGASAFTCWAFSAASMISNSCRVLVTNLTNRGLMNQARFKKCVKTIDDPSFHVQNRNQIMMILLPRKLHVDDQSQQAFLRAAVSRLANPTIIDKEGIYYLNQVNNLLRYQLGLSCVSSPLKTSYTTYYNDQHPDFVSGLRPLIQHAVNMKFCPVASIDSTKIPSVSSGTGSHALVLDTIQDGKFIFKNTYSKNKEVTIPMNKGPLKFYYLNIKLTEEAEEKLRCKTESETPGDKCRLS